VDIGRGFFRCDYGRPHFFGAKLFGFFEIYGVSARKRGDGVEPVRTFNGQREGSIFRDFVFMNGS